MDYIKLEYWNDLPEIAGIKYLTGEACAYSQRLLCDVNEDGLAMLQDYFGVPGLKLADAYNSEVAGKPSVGSLMLARLAFEPLVEFILAEKGAIALLYRENKVVGGLMTEDYVNRYTELSERSSASMHAVQRIYRPAQHAVGSRNVHAATSRVL